MTFLKNTFAVWIAVMAVLLVSGCATTGKDYKTASSDGSTNVDQLLGVGDSNTEGEINEDDVLKLLGVSDETKSDASSSQSEQSLASTKNAESQVSIQTETDTKSRQETALQQTRLPTEQTAGAKTDRANASFQSDTYYGRYQDALQTYRSKNYRDAVQKFEALIASDSRHDLADNCQYWIGESYYDLQNYQQAIVAFEKVFTYARSNKDDSAQLKLGMCYLHLNEKEKAKEEFQKLVRNYPASEYVGIAKRFIGQVEGAAAAP